ncbi:MAG TPA: hypothetical protein VN696_07960 [Pyrinomonadaceae bacterium]|nr:hypothetical protein [Pyrinomonadaceae bacterium]
MKIFGIVSLGLILLGGCGKLASEDTSAQESRTKISNMPSQLEKLRQPVFRVAEQHVEGLSGARALYFFDKMHGWLASEKKVYKSEDAGTSWQIIEVPLLAGASVKQFFFVNSSTGWLVAQNGWDRDSIRDYGDLGVQLLHTSDGGKSWTVQYQGRQVIVSAILFSTAQQGWLAGTKYLDPEGTTYTYFFLQTADGGQHWADLADQILRTTSAGKSSTDNYQNDGLMGLVEQGPNHAITITAHRKIIETVDGGRSWRQKANLYQGPDPASIRRFGITDNRLWVASSMDAVEGIVGELAVSETDNEWRGHALPNAYFADVTWLSKDEFFASGYVKSIMKATGYQHAAIFYSSNRGSSWSIVYTHPGISNIRILAKVDSNSVWAVSDDQLLLKLERASPIPPNE